MLCHLISCYLVMLLLVILCLLLCRLPFAQCYGGHQFGMWAGQLGDGRAISLGEILNSKSQRWELQLKGAGKTPYSRFADGLAVLRSSIREFLCSEAMHHLGIPTTRALCLVTTGKLVTRDMFYEYVITRFFFFFCASLFKIMFLEPVVFYGLFKSLSLRKLESDDEPALVQQKIRVAKINDMLCPLS